MEHTCVETHTDRGAHGGLRFILQYEMSSASSSECGDVAKRGKQETDGEGEGQHGTRRERGRKPGDMKHTETNKSSSFAYCCILMRWLQESILDVVDHDRGRE